MDVTKKEIDSFILFDIAGTNYGLRSRDVQQLEMLDQVTRVPNAPPFVDGIIFARGQVIPIVNLRARFGFPRISLDMRARVIVVKTNGRTVGLLVDSAREFVSIALETIHPPSDMLVGLSGKYLEGIGKVGDRLVLLVDLQEILRDQGPGIRDQGQEGIGRD